MVRDIEYKKEPKYGMHITRCPNGVLCSDIMPDSGAALGVVHVGTEMCENCGSFLNHDESKQTVRCCL